MELILQHPEFVTATFYVRDASGNVMAVYKTSGTTNLSLEEQHIYGSSRLGIFKKDKTIKNKARALGERRYELTDHLGNVRVVMSDYKRTAVIVLSATDYYPFGMVARSYSSSVMPRFGYQSQEIEHELWGGEASSFKYRISDNRLGRFFNVDPLTNKYPWNSPYAFSENRVIDGIELEGREVVLIGINSKASCLLSGFVEGGIIIAPDGIFEYSSYGYGGETDASVGQTLNISFYPTMPSGYDAGGGGSSVGLSAGGAGITVGISSIKSGQYDGIALQAGYSVGFIKSLPIYVAGNVYFSETDVSKVTSWSTPLTSLQRQNLQAGRLTLATMRNSEIVSKNSLSTEVTNLQSKNVILQRQINSTQDVRYKQQLQNSMNTNNQKIEAIQKQIAEKTSNIDTYNKAINIVDQALAAPPAK
jgi:hypothetical protein